MANSTTMASIFFFPTIRTSRSSSIRHLPHQKNHYSKLCNLNQRRFLSVHIKSNNGQVCCSQVKEEGGVDDEACELVSGVKLTIGEGDDSTCASLFKAMKNNNGTGILLLSDVFGFEDSSTRDFAYRVACNGYNVLVPDLFHGDPWSKYRLKSDFEQWVARQEPVRVAKYIDFATKWLSEEFLAANISKQLGIIGFGFGGGKVMEVLAQDQGSCFGTGISLYGTGMDLSLASNIKVPVLFICGDQDPICPVHALNHFEKRIGGGSRVAIFEGRGHGFVHQPDTPGDDEDAEKAFTMIRTWLYNGVVMSS